MSDVGFHNAGGAKTRKRLRDEGLFRDNSTVIVTPSRADTMPIKVVQYHQQLDKGMNQKVMTIPVVGMEVGAAYQQTVERILADPVLSTWKYMLTLEDDNLPPPDGLKQLWSSIGDYAAVGGLYWTKGYGGQPMIYGDPRGILNFLPQVPRVDTLQECNGLGMGFTLFRLDVFREIEPPWFKTLDEAGAKETQDLFYFEKVRRAGFKVACDTRVRVGHYDHAGTFGPAGFVW